jgi:hypothetical protein
VRSNCVVLSLVLLSPRLGGQSRESARRPSQGEESSAPPLEHSSGSGHPRQPSDWSSLLQYALRTIRCGLRGSLPAKRGSARQLRAGRKRRSPQEARADLRFLRRCFSHASPLAMQLGRSCRLVQEAYIDCVNDLTQRPRSIRWFNDVSCPRLWLLSRIQRCRPPPSVSPRTVRQRAIT